MGAQLLADRLGHRFTQPQLLRQALTHRSYGVPNNERLEFLGDGILDFVVAAMLYQRFSDLPEGDLSRLRANLVRQEALHERAQALDIGAFLLLGEGEMKSGGSTRPSILADALEALLGAIYLDGGFAAAEGVIRGLYADAVAAIKPGQFQKDAKTRLQEWLQGRKKPLPRYALLETSGAAHAQRFVVACYIQQPALHTTGEGASRRIAEQCAAEQALKALNA